MNNNNVFLTSSIIWKHSFASVLIIKILYTLLVIIILLDQYNK